jgi:transcriptional regulator with XRE-family HTH domain
MRFGAFIEHYRLRARLSAGRVARMLDFSGVYLREIEQGKSPPFLDEKDRYEKLAILLSVEREELLLRAILERGDMPISVAGWSTDRVKALIAAVDILRGPDPSLAADRLLKTLGVGADRP